MPDIIEALNSVAEYADSSNDSNCMTVKVWCLKHVQHQKQERREHIRIGRRIARLVVTPEIGWNESLFAELGSAACDAVRADEAVCDNAQEPTDA